MTLRQALKDIWAEAERSAADQNGMVRLGLRREWWVARLELAIRVTWWWYRGRRAFIRLRGVGWRIAQTGFRGDLMDKLVELDGRLPTLVEERRLAVVQAWKGLFR